jgi:hypothetical protein
MNDRRSAPSNVTILHHNARDITGQKFGYLVAIRVVKRSSYGNHWLFECICGNTVERLVTRVKDMVRQGYKPSCGCWGKTTINWLEANRDRIITVYKRNAEARGLEYSLSLEDAMEVFKRPCYYCGEDPNTIGDECNKHCPFIYSGIDRFDNTIGYVVGNVVACCTKCNMLKRDMSYEEFIAVITKIARRHGITG